MTTYRFPEKETAIIAPAASPLINRLLSLRNINNADAFLTPDYETQLHDPFLLHDMDKAVTRIESAMASNEIIAIFSDYDCDGIPGAVVLHDCFKAIGYANFINYIPHRHYEGFGLNTSAIDKLAAQGVKLIITIDCGTSDVEAIAYAKEKGVDVIVTDHHEPHELLPEAIAIINPKLGTYPFTELCGASTVFKLAQALLAHGSYTVSPGQEKWWLDMVGIATIADMVPLVGENRVFARFGLQVLRKSRRPGIQQLLSKNKIDQRYLTEEDIGFTIGPRINAASRMAHAMLAHDLLMESNVDVAGNLALELENHNNARRKLSTDTTEQVKLLVETEYQNKKFIFAVGEEYPFGIVGLIAGRIAHTYRKPTCVLFRGATESMGSFRSIPEFNIIEAIEKCSDLLVKFGGHTQAAGMTIKNENLDVFYERFSALVEENLREVVTEPEMWIDMEIQPTDIVPRLVTDITRFAPFGEGNTEPVFALSDMRVKQVRFVGNGNKHLKFSLESPDGLKSFDAIGFSLGERFPMIVEGDRLDIAFTLEENTWNGRSSIQLKLIDLCRKGA